MPAHAADARRLAVAVALTGALAGQSAPPAPDFRLHVAFASAPHRHAMPAIAWLCDQYLPRQTAWPDGLDPRQPFALTLTPTGITIAATDVRVPRDVVAVGDCEIDGSSALTFRCATDGSDDWYLPADFVPPQPWHRLLTELDAADLGVPRTVTASVLIGHFAGALGDGDPRAQALQLGASLCGDVTWVAWRNGSQLRVRGRSDGGLTLPAVLLLLAADDGPRTHGLSVRAFAARDVDRVEAARQLVRADEAHALPALRSLLQADDRTRLFAIDALVRLGAADELPAIVAAADTKNPWATLAAADAVKQLWTEASPDARRRVHMAIARCDSVLLRSLPTHTMPTRHAPASPLEPPDAAARARALVWLALIGTGLFGLWLRERRRAAGARG